MKKYSLPSIHLISLGTEAACLYVTSEIPTGDKPGYFDTKQQRSPIWPEDSSDK